MKRSIALLAAAVLVGGVSVPAGAQDQDAANSDQALEQRLRSLFPQGSVEFDDRTPIEMRVATESMIDRTLEKGRLREAFTQLSRVNRNQMGDLSDQHLQTLERELDAFERAFQEKYNEGLNIQEVALLDNAPTVRAMVQDADAITRLPYRPLSRPVAQDSARAQADQTDQAQPAAARQGAYGASSETYGIDDNSKIGVLVMPEKGGIANLVVTAVEESRPGAGDMAGDWRLIIPLQVRGDTVAVNVAQHLRDLRERQDNWPENPQDTREILARRVLMAYYNIDPVQSQNQTGQPARQGQQQPAGQPAPQPQQD